MTAPARPDPAIEGIRGFLLRGIGAVALISFGCNLGALAGPLFNMQVFNRVLPSRDLGTLKALVVALAICLVIYTVVDMLRALALEALALRVTRRFALPLLQTVAATRQGGATNQALADLEGLRSFIASPGATAPFDLIWAPVLLLVLLTEHWAFAALGALFCLILGGLNLAGDRLARRRLLAANREAADALREAGEAITAADAVIALGMLPTWTRRFHDARRRTARLTARALGAAKLIAALTTTLRMAMTAAMVGLGLVLAINGEASTGSMVAGNMIMARLLLPFQQVATARRRWIDAWAAFARIQTALETPLPVRYAHALPAPVPRLVVERLVYIPAGGDRATLRGVSFTVEPGSCIGIVGPSGAGKSTLLQAIVGMLSPTAGGAYLDGTSTFLWEREDFARHVGYVPQTLALLDESIAANIARLQTPDVSAIVAAASRVGLHETILRLPFGYATPLKPGLLSGGQRQRLALARALCGAPRLLVLDEPTAFLDTAGEADFLALLGQLRREGVTVLLVTHRPAMLAGTDKVLVLQDGAVAQFGPPDEISRALAPPAARREVVL